MFPEKYAPKTTREMIGNRIAVSEITNFLKQWKKGQALMVTGESGVGKTLAVRTVANELDYEIIEIGADEDRGREKMDRMLAASLQGGLMKRKKIFLIDELDQMESMKGIYELIEKSGHPVVLIALDAYEKKFLTLRQKCRIIAFQKIRCDSIASFLKSVCEKERLDVDEARIEQIAKMSSGDVRAALIDLEILSCSKDLNTVGFREKKQKIFEVIKIIFKTRSMENALIALDGADDPEEVHRWIAANLHAEYDDIEDIARAYEMLSLADIFYARIIRRQSWQLQKYFFELSSAGVALSKNRDYHKFVKYERPRFWPRKNSDAAKKAAEKLHISGRRISEYSQLLHKSAKNKKLLDEMGLTREELREI
jgi:replication factor C large subunit